MSFQEFKMFPRAELKWRGKEALRGHWTDAIVITLLMTMFTYAANYIVTKAIYPGITIRDFFFNMRVFFEYLVETGLENFTEGNWIFVSIVGTVSGLLVGGVFAMAMTKWYVDLGSKRQDVQLGDFFGNFSYGISGILMYLWVSLWMGIWSMIFVIPTILLFAVGDSSGLAELLVIPIFLGMIVLIIYKSIQYAFAFFALADHPEIGVRKALRASIEVTKGKVGDVFLFFLSFIGWAILSSIIPLAALYVTPYMTSAEAQLWFYLRDRAFDENRLNPADFGLTLRSDEVAETAAVETVDIEQSRSHEEGEKKDEL